MSTILLLILPGIEANPLYQCFSSGSPLEVATSAARAMALTLLVPDALRVKSCTFKIPLTSGDTSSEKRASKSAIFAWVW